MKEIEDKILGEILLADTKEQLDAVVQLEGLFSDPFNTQVLRNISKLAFSGKHADALSLYQTTENKPENYAVLLSSYTLGVHSSAQLFQHIDFLRFEQYRAGIKKELQLAVAEIEGSGFQDVEDIKERVINKLSVSSLLDKPKFISLAYQKEQLIVQLNSNHRIEGFSWGISDLDKWTSGIIPSRMYVLGGLKKGGKTRFVIQTMKELYKQDVKTGFLSLEMPAYEINKLLHSTFLEINDLRFRSGSLLKPEERSAFESLEFNEELFGIECKSGLTIEQVLGRIKIMAQLGFRVIFIDYLQRIKKDIKREAQELESHCNRIADYCRENKVAIILLSQLNALAEREAPNPGHLKGSGGIGESADTIILFDNVYRRTKSESDKNKVRLVIEQRYGDSGVETIYTDLGICKFANYGIF